MAGDDGLIGGSARAPGCPRPMTASPTPPVLATADVPLAPIDAAGLQQSWDRVCQYGNQVPLFFYSSLLRTAREALAYEFDRLGEAGSAPGAAPGS